MGTKIIIFIALLSSTACATSTKSESIGENEIKYAISYCLSSSYPDSEFSKDAGYISGAYLQKGDYGLDIYETIRDFVSEYKENAYVSKHGKNLNIMQCIDLIESDKLKALIKKIANNSIQPTANASAD